ncbi:cell surface protein SprA [Bacteroidota bacterium]
MNIRIKYFYLQFVFLSFFLSYYNARAVGLNSDPGTPPAPQTFDTTELKYPFKDPSKSQYFDQDSKSGLKLDNPSNFEQQVEYDIKTDQYIISEKVGNYYIQRPMTLSREEYGDYLFKQSLRDYWYEKSTSNRGQFQSSFLPNLNFGGEAFDKLFGTNKINIVPQGSAELSFGIQINRIENPNISERLRRNTTFDFDSKIQMNVLGTIGDKMRVGINYDTEATFEFENKAKLQYTGEEDEIIKKIEAGNVSLPLAGTLIQGSQNLLGIKTELQFGRLTVTTVLSQQKGKSKTITVEGGAQISEFEIKADEYDANKHFFLSQTFRERYNEALNTLPIINSSVKITKIEVWVTNKRGDFQNARNIVAFMDLAEKDRVNIYSSDVFPTTRSAYPSNKANNLYKGVNNQTIRDISTVAQSVNAFSTNLRIGQDYEKIENARRLNTSEYKINTKLGYISLNSALNSDEILAVAYSYVAEGDTFKVGEFTNDFQSPKVLVLKLLKGTNLTPKLNTWNLMMKNVYALGAYQINRNDFRLQIQYQDDETGNSLNYIPEEGMKENQIIELLDLDNLNSQLDAYPDGRFDFIEGITINSSNGRVFFPVLEPFGRDMKGAFDKYAKDPSVSEEYVYNELYDSTLTIAQQIAEKNKFVIKGTYKSTSGSEISLNAFNVPQGSVKVSAGGKILEENQDYTVDYTLGRVTIINQGLLQSGTPIQVSLENNALFDLQQKTMVGSHFDYRFNDNVNIGATILNLTERPLTQKVNIGDEPISNTIWGLNSSYKTDSRFITNVIDKLPLIETKVPSTITLVGEFAHLIPGHNKVIDKKGEVYIDDFEGSKINIDVKHFSAWTLASTPQGQPELFPEGDSIGSLVYGYNRAKLAWYVIDPLFLRNDAFTPAHIKRDNQSQSNFFVHEFYVTDLFPNRENPNNIPIPMAILNLAYYPNEKGPYNYDIDSIISEGNRVITFGINEKGDLNAPETRWGGIMREIRTNDFEAANIEFLEFWLMDPFAETENPTDEMGGDLYINLGNISEDILKDGRKSFENGLPSSDSVTLVDTTIWGRIPQFQPSVNAFNNSPQSRRYQDVGLDGLNDREEKVFFYDYINRLKNKLNTVIYSDSARLLLDDPSNDNYHYYRGSDYDNQMLGILERYKKYNGMEGNSPSAEQSGESFSTSGRSTPDAEDINEDFTLSEGENYFQYRVELKPSKLRVGENFIADSIHREITMANKKKKGVTWYQFKIPLEANERIGNIQDFKSIRFMRMFLKNFDDPVILRFATLDLIRSEWRKYNLTFREGGEYVTTPQIGDSKFDISAVNFEENGSRRPVNYVLPPDISRVIDPYNPQIRQLNEQSIVLKVLDLPDGDAKAAYKNLYMDLRQYGNIEMEVHAEAIDTTQTYNDEVTAFIRLGSDYKNNFYEYEVPLKLTKHLGEGELFQNSSNRHRLIVWPSDNRFEIDLEIFQKVKQLRNRSLREPNSNVEITSVFEIPDESNPKNIVRISGNPNLSNVRTIMIGIRNPSKSSGRVENDDGLPESVEVWFNELRLTNINKKGGWAANGRVTTKLADLGSVTVAGNHSTPGFGSIAQKVEERSREYNSQIDVSGNLQLGKFFPEEMSVNIPVYAGVTNNIITPEYDPLDPDIPLRITLENARNKAERDSIKKYAREVTQRKSVNLTNVKINKYFGNPMPWSIPNFSYSYNWNEVLYTSFDTKFRIERNKRHAFTYNYSIRPKNVTPLRSVKFLNNPLLLIIRDFNFNYYPSSISFRTNLESQFSGEQFQNLINPEEKLRAYFKPQFNWNRFFDLKWDIANSLRVDFSATTNARIDAQYDTLSNRYHEQKYFLRQNSYDMYYDEWTSEIKDSIWKNQHHNVLIWGGRKVRYNHNFNASYTVPINKISFLNWISSSLRYNGTYTWEAGPILKEVDGRVPNVGNTIRNSNTIQGSAQFNMINLYNKSKYLDKINQKYRQTASKRNTKKEFKTINYTKENVSFDANKPKSIFHRLNTLEITLVKITDENGLEVPGEWEVVNEDKVEFTSEKNVQNASVMVEGEVEVKPNPLIIILENTTRLLMSTRNLSLTYSQTNGSVLPGYENRPRLFGTDWETNYSPGFPFILGWQPDTNQVREMVIQNGWMVKEEYLNQPYSLTNSETVNLNASLEPINGLRIDLRGNRTQSRGITQYYEWRWDSIAQRFHYDFNTLTETGNFSMSYISFRSWEKADTSNNYVSKVFADFRNNITKEISERQNFKRREEGLNYSETPNDTGYYEGLGQLSQDVLIPSFLAAYGIKGSDKVSLGFPGYFDFLPNWRITYDGLGKLNIVKKYFRTITLGHAYSSNYNINSFKLNPEYNSNNPNRIHPSNKNYIPKYEINSVSLSERFSPLINIELTWINNILTRFEYKKDRTLSLSLSNNQLTEIQGREYIFGTGFRFNEVQLIINDNEFNSDLNIRLDYSIRNNITLLRYLLTDFERDIPDVSTGAKINSIRLTADYVLSDRFNLRLFFDRIVNTPHVSTNYPRYDTNFGFTIGFTLIP